MAQREAAAIRGSRSRLPRGIGDAAPEGLEAAGIGLLDLRPRTVASLRAAGILRVALGLALTGRELEALLRDGAEGHTAVGAALADADLGSGRGGSGRDH